MNCIPKEFSTFISEHVRRDSKTMVMFSDHRVFDDFLMVYGEIGAKTDNASIVLLDYHLHPLLQKKNLEFRYIFDYATYYDYAHINSDSETKAQNWFFSGSDKKDVTSVEGLSFGMLLEYEMGMFFHKIYKATEDVIAFIKKAKPDAFVLLTCERQSISNVYGDIENNLYQAIIRYLAPKSNIPLYELHVPSPRISGWIDQEIKSLCALEPLRVPGTGWQPRFPAFVVRGAKAFFILIKNILSEANLNPSGSNILFSGQTSLSYFGNKFIDRLSCRKDINVFVYKGESPKNGIVNLYGHFESIFSMFRRNKIRKLMAGRLKEFSGSNDASEGLSYKTVPVGELFKEFFDFIFLDLIPEMGAEVRILRRLLRSRRIKLILAHSDLTRMEREVIAVGRESGVPSINYQHGVEGRVHGGPMGFPRFATHKAAWGIKRKNWLAERGLNPDTVSIVGCVLHEMPKVMTPNDHLRMEQKGFLLYFPHPGTSHLGGARISDVENERILKLLVSVMSRLPQKNLVIKLRPFDLQGEIYNDIIKRNKVENVRIVHDGLPDLFRECDLFLTPFSTAGVEAMMFDKPGIQITFITNQKDACMGDSMRWDIPYASYRAALDLSEEDPELLYELIQSIYCSAEVRKTLMEGRKRFLKDYCNYGGGDPVENLLKFVDSILCDKSKAPGLESGSQK